MLVIDASVAFKWLVREDDSDLARAVTLLPERLAAPELVLVEVANAVWKNVQRGQLPASHLTSLTLQLPDWYDELLPLRPLLPRAAAIADALHHPVHDCFYLALAERENASLVTADRRLLARVAGTPWAVHARDLASFAGTA